MTDIANRLEPVQIVSFIVILITMIMIWAQMRQQPNQKYWYFPVMLWMIHGLIFYGTLFIDRLGYLPEPVNPIYTEWSR
jgi:hypothetical protein